MMFLNFKHKQYIQLFFIVISISLWSNTSTLAADLIFIVDSGGTDDFELSDGQILLSDRPGEALFISTAAIEMILAVGNSIEITASVSITQNADAIIDYQSGNATLSLNTVSGDILIQNTIASGEGGLVISSGGSTFISSNLTSLGDINLNGEVISINADININAGNLTMNAATGITASTGSTLTIMGTSTLSTSFGNINLHNVSNDFVGAVNAAGSVVKLADANSIELGNIEATTLTVIAGIATVISGQSVINVISSSTFTIF